MNSDNSVVNNKVVVITGSSKGIGKATAILLCENGAKLVLNGRDKIKLDQTVEELRSMGFDVIGVNSDVSTPEGSSLLIDEAVKAFGTVDILVNNAGVSMRGNIDELDASVFQKVFSINVFGSVYPLIYALPYIKENSGSVVFISSVAGIRGLPTLSVYCSSKMALKAIAESMRFELKKYDVHTGLIYVGYAENDEGKTYVSQDGSLKPIEKRENASSQEDIAKVVLRTIKRRKFIVVLSGLGRLNAIMQRISPRFVEWMIMRNYNKLESMSK